MTSGRAKSALRKKQICEVCGRVTLKEDGTCRWYCQKIKELRDRLLFVRSELSKSQAESRELAKEIVFCFEYHPYRCPSLKAWHDSREILARTNTKEGEK